MNIEDGVLSFNPLSTGHAPPSVDFMPGFGPGFNPYLRVTQRHVTLRAILVSRVSIPIYGSRTYVPLAERLASISFNPYLRVTHKDYCRSFSG